MTKGKKWGLIILAAVIGEIALVLLTTVAQEVLYDGINYYTSSPSDLIFGGLATLMAAVLAGMIASAIVRGQNYWPQVIISVIIITEMTYLMASGVLTSPIWFDTMAGLSLLLGIWLGRLFYLKYFPAPQRNFG